MSGAQRPGAPSSNTLGHRQANRRCALGTAAKYLHDNDITLPDCAAWLAEVTDLAERLLPWLDSGLPADAVPSVEWPDGVSAVQS